MTWQPFSSEDIVYKTKKEIFHFFFFVAFLKVLGTHEQTLAGATPLSIMTFSITTLSIKGLHVTVSIIDTEHE